MVGDNLCRELLPVFRSTPNAIIEDSIRSVGALPGIENWNHQIRQFWDAMRVVRWGLPLHLVHSEPSFHDLRRRFGTAILAEGQPRDCDRSEAEAAGFLALFADRVEYVKQPDTKRMYDLLTHWSDGSTVEVEVTLAEEKHTQRDRQVAAQKIAEAFQAKGCPHDMFVHIVDYLTEVECEELLAAASDVSPGTSIHDDERWHLRVEVVPPRDPGVVFVAGADHHPPPWFPEQNATPFIVLGSAATYDQTVPPPRIHIYWGLSKTGYINPLEKKVSHFQGSSTEPFVLAIDVAELPAAYQLYEKELPTWFTTWDHISGALAFELRSDLVSRIFWIWQFFPNPSAVKPVSSKVQELLKPGRWENGFPLYSKP